MQQTIVGEPHVDNIPISISYASSYLHLVDHVEPGNADSVQALANSITLEVVKLDPEKVVIQIICSF